jgi:hypothetical protein
VSIAPGATSVYIHFIETQGAVVTLAEVMAGMFYLSLAVHRYAAFVFIPSADVGIEGVLCLF